MKLKELNASGAWVFLTEDELLMVSNALNEVCNGLDVPEFATRMGGEREEALSLLKNISSLYDKIAKHDEGTQAK